LAAEVVQRHRTKIERAIVAGFDSTSVAQRLKAAELALKMGLRSEAINVAEDKVESEGRSREEPVTALMKSFEGPVGAILARELVKRQGIVEATAADVIELPAQRFGKA
jgi:hypothetical protein